MVVVELRGGLGNQLFQYAAGRALSLKLGCALGLDARRLEVDEKRQYALDVYRHSGLYGLRYLGQKMVQRLTTTFQRQRIPLPRFQENRAKRAILRRVVCQI